jgi:HAE1 family hydrophobic/amphiphilic exporter-1
MNIPEFSVNKKVTVTMLTILVIILGAFTFSQMGLEMMPEMDYPMVSVVTAYPGASSEDIENTLTKPLETALAGVKGIKSLKSQSVENQSIIVAEFEWGVNLDFASQDMRDAMDRISDQLPDDAHKPMVLKINMSASPILLYSVIGGSDTYTTRKFLEDNVEQKLKHIDGVATIMIAGGNEVEIQIVIDKTKLDKNNISIDKIVNILKAQNINVPASHVVKRQNDLLIRTTGEYENVKEIENTPINMSKSGNIVYIKDVSTVIKGYKEQRFNLRSNKQDAVMMAVSKESGANTLNVSKDIKAEISSISEEYKDKNIRFIEIMDQGQIVEMVTNTGGQSAVIGGLLAIVIMFLFLRNWRPTLVISLAIPISVIATFIPLQLSGYSLNIMTLGGLALGVGMLVDNAVVVIENIFRHLEMGDDRITSAKIGATEVGMAITASTLTTVAVFVPMMFAGGIAGQLIKGLALTVSFALFMSLFISLTIVPMFASVLFKVRNSKEEYKEAAGENKFGMFKRGYTSVLKWTLKHRITVLLSVFTILIGSLFLIPKIGTEFMPAQDMPMQVLKVRMPAGTSLAETDMITSRLEDIVLDINEVQYVLINEGSMGGVASQASISPSGINEAVIIFKLSDKEDRDRVSSQIMEEVRRKSPDLSNVELSVIDISTQMMSGGESAPIAIKLFGKDLSLMEKISSQIANKIKTVDGIRDVNNSMKEQQPEEHIIVDRDKAFRYGLTVAQIGSAVRTSSLGTESGIFRDENGDEIDIRVRLNEQNRNSLQEIEYISINSPLGFSVPLKQIAEIRNGYGPISITREHQMRLATITANIYERDLGSTVIEIKNSLDDIQKSLPSGYFIEYGGTYESMSESFETLFQALILAIILIYVIMASQFESFSQPLVIMFTLPLAVIGVLLALYLTGTTLNVPALIGIIILAGIVVNNGIVLIDHTNQLRAKGLTKHEALLQSGRDRFRPVLITSLTTIIGMLPMALTKGQGSEMSGPMATAVIGGLTSATFFTLLIVPILYSIVDHASEKASKKAMKHLHGEKA